MFKKLLKLIFYIFLGIYLFFFCFCLSIIRQWLLISLYEALPIILPIGLMYYCTVDLFTPNPKHNSLYGWLYAEFLEHIVLPAVIILTALIPFAFIFGFIFLIYYFYGHLLGEIKSLKDVYKLLILILLFIFLSFFPDLMLFLNVYTGSGWVFIISSTSVFSFGYFIYQLYSSVSLDPSFRKVLKGIAVLGTGVFITVFILKL